VEPLVSTLQPTVFANRFSGENKTVWTLFNAEFRTFRGDVLRVPHAAGTKYEDAFSGEQILPRVEGDTATLPITLGPKGVGAIIAQR